MECVQCRAFLNADLIAAGLWPFSPKHDTGGGPVGCCWNGSVNWCGEQADSVLKRHGRGRTYVQLLGGHVASWLSGCAVLSVVAECGYVRDMALAWCNSHTRSPSDDSIRFTGPRLPGSSLGAAPARCCRSNAISKSKMSADRSRKFK